MYSLLLSCGVFVGIYLYLFATYVEKFGKKVKNVQSEWDYQNMIRHEDATLFSY